MTAGIATYNDFRGLAELRARAEQQSPEASREAARQFEALFVQMMLKSMRDATAVLGEKRDRTYDEMFDQQIAMEMTRGQGLGLADMLVRQLRLTDATGLSNGGPLPDRLGTAAVPATGTPAGLEALTGPLATRSPDLAAAMRAALDAALAPLAEAPASGPAADDAPPAPVAAAPATAAATNSKDFRPASRFEFVAALWPHAEAAGRELGVDPRAIVAQAALETGWGARQIRAGDGRSAFNLFGIKADARWDGSRVGVTTLEYEAGLPVPQRAQFRAYESLREGVADYVRFLKDNPRYGTALRDGADGGDFAAGLQAAGYATDPGYASKIRNILTSPGLNAAIAVLKTGPRLPMQAASGT